MSLLLLFYTSGEEPPVDPEVIYGVASFQLETIPVARQENVTHASILLEVELEE